MWATRYWNARYWASRYWPKVGAVAFGLPLSIYGARIERFKAVNFRIERFEMVNARVEAK